MDCLMILLTQYRSKIAITEGPPNQIFTESSWTSSLRKIQEETGVYSHIQIIILTDFQDYEDDCIRVRSTFASKVHLFCFCDAAQTEKQAIVPTTIKEEALTAKPSQFIPLNRKWDRFTKQNNGSLYMIERGSNYKSHSIDSLLSRHYPKYAGYLAFGHMTSAIELFPDPNLVIWESSRPQVPHVLSIIAFTRTLHVSSPKCTSKHTILRLSDDVNSPYGKTKLIRAKPYTATDQPATANFFDLLHDVLLAEKSSALVRFNDKQHAYISVAYDTEHTGMVMSVLDDSFELKQSEDHNSTMPWIRNSLERMVELTIHHESKTQAMPRNLLEALANQDEENISRTEKEVCRLLDAWRETHDKAQQDEQDPYKKDVNKKIYNYNLKSAKEIVPFSKKQTLQNDFQKVLRMVKNLPAKVQVMYCECEKIRYTSAVYMNRDIVIVLSNLLQEQRDHMSSDPEKGKVVVILDRIISHLRDDGVWSKKLYDEGDVVINDDELDQPAAKHGFNIF
ncbi:hypothetical protein AKO1_014365 [Acrasis kona]|uniref:Uncharacterized protein n=1 Tax=Acrasis kona TaxID=1008807 RepID=A0AAW2Z074_9EUKA